MIAFCIGSFYMLLALEYLELGSRYTDVLYKKSYMIAVILMALWGFFSYYILKFLGSAFPPLWKYSCLPECMILAFTKSDEWLLTGELAPPMITGDGHYLCTVSLRSQCL